MDSSRQTLLSHPDAPYNQSVLLREIPTSNAPSFPAATAQPSPGRLLIWWHLTSLDAPTVAVCWCLALARVTHVHLPLWVPVALGLGTWSIYLGDRLMDAKRALAPLRQRHWFHWKHRQILLPAAILSLAVALALVLRRMPPAIRDRDALLALAAAVYFLAIHSRSAASDPMESLHFADGDTAAAPASHPASHPSAQAAAPSLSSRVLTSQALPSRVSPSQASPSQAQPSALRRLRHLFTKETFVGLIFALVCAAPAATRAAGGYAVLVAPVAACFLLAWLNCWLIERWDAGRSGGYLRQLALAAAASLAALLAFLGHSGAAGWFLVAMAASALLLAWLERHRLRLGALVLRAAADLVLLTPLILLLGHPGL